MPIFDAQIEQLRIPPPPPQISAGGDEIGSYAVNSSGSLQDYQTLQSQEKEWYRAVCARNVNEGKPGTKNTRYLCA